MVPLESLPNGAYLGVRGGLRLNCCAWGQAIVYNRMGNTFTKARNLNFSKQRRFTKVPKPTKGSQKEKKRFRPTLFVRAKEKAV